MDQFGRSHRKCIADWPEREGTGGSCGDSSCARGGLHKTRVSLSVSYVCPEPVLAKRRSFLSRDCSQRTFCSQKTFSASFLAFSAACSAFFFACGAQNKTATHTHTHAQSDLMRCPFIKMIILPRQTRDKHRETPPKKDGPAVVFLPCRACLPHPCPCQYPCRTSGRRLFFVAQKPTRAAF